MDLSRDEDSVTSLAVAQSSSEAIAVFAGINSSTADQQAGRNEHLRSFELAYPKSQSSDAHNEKSSQETSEKGATRPLGKVSLFTPASGAKQETYQRLLRLSPASRESNIRLGAVATGLAPKGELVIFDASTLRPTQQSIYGKVHLNKEEEVAGLDIIESEGEYLIAYCTDYEVYLCRVPFLEPPGGAQGSSIRSRFLNGIPLPDFFETAGTRPKYRSLCFLTPNLILLLQNQHNRKGAELLLMEVQTPTSSGTIILRKRLHKSIKSASALSTSTLRPPTAKQNIQHVIAVAGQDITLTILTLDHFPGSQTNKSLKFRTHTILRDVHPLQITALTFSTFDHPNTVRSVPRYLKLASVSMGSTVVVHTFPLSPDPPPAAKSKHPARYVLTVPGHGETAQFGFSVLFSIVVVAIGAFLLQAFTEIRGGTPEYLGAKSWLSRSVHDYIARPYMFENISNAAPVIASNLPNVEDVRVNIPSGEDLKKKLPSKEDIANQAGNVRALQEKIPSTEQVTENLPSSDELREQLPNVENLKHQIPSAEDIKEQIPSSDEIKEHIPSAQDVQENVPSSNDLQRQADEALHKIASNLPDPSFLGTPKQSLRHLLSIHSPHASTSGDPPVDQKAIILRDSGSEVSADVHHDPASLAKEESEARRWEELQEHEKVRWRKRLVEAGHWVEEEGEAVLTGVFFSNVAGLVGDVVGGALGGE